MEQERIRNFCIIAHIDHGKSTLADRLLERTGTVSQRRMTDQLLDRLELEQEHGITIKLQPVRMLYQAQDGQDYELNLIDTPGHVDFNYEVSRSLAACEGALLVVDATQGVEAQTLANLYLALDQELAIVPVINKIDLPSANIEQTRSEMETMAGIPAEEAILASAKEGTGIDEILERVVHQIPPPSGDVQGPLRALVFDSYYDAYKGVVVTVRIRDGALAPGMQIAFMNTGHRFEVDEVGIFTPWPQPVDRLETGEVGYFTAAIKSVQETRVGDTVTDAQRPAHQPLPGYRHVQPMVYCGLYPQDPDQYDDLREALERLALSDAALQYEQEVSAALGFGFRCGMLGLLHAEIVQERLEREYGLDLVTTAPTVVYRAHLTDGQTIEVRSPAQLPASDRLQAVEEPYVRAEMYVPQAYIGPVMELCQHRHGRFVDMRYLGGPQDRVCLIYEMALADIIFDFFDQLKSRTKGYASLDYEPIGYRAADLVRLDVLINGTAVDALSVIVHRDEAQRRGKQLVSRLRELIPRQLFEVPIQAAIGGRVIARENVPAMRKNVLAKCYGGDVSRKKKLLEKQREGKRRMKQIGRVDIPQEAFMAVLRLDDETH